MQIKSGTIIDRLTLISLAVHSPGAVVRVNLDGTKWYEHAKCLAEERNDWIWEGLQSGKPTIAYVRQTQNDHCATCRDPL